MRMELLNPRDDAREFRRDKPPIEICLAEVRGGRWNDEAKQTAERAGCLRLNVKADCTASVVAYRMKKISEAEYANGEVKRVVIELLHGPLVTVIVPIYMVERYLRECVDSILVQTYGNLEIILVDDGSRDSCGAICDDYAARDSRVVALHKANGGLSDARNFGLRHAHGEWISFVDSDDYVSPVFVEALLRAAEGCGCDIAAVPGGKSFRDGEPCELVDRLEQVAAASTMDTRMVQKALLYQAFDTGAVWRLYRRSVLGVDPFPVGLYYEDLATTYRFIHEVNEIAIIDCRDLYAYRMRSSSIIRQAYSSIKTRSALEVSEQLKRELVGWYPELSDAVASRCFSVCRMVFAQVPTGLGTTTETSRDREALWQVLKENRRTVLRDSHARKRERLAAAIASVGEDAFSLFCSLCRRVGAMR